MDARIKPAHDDLMGISAPWKKLKP